MADSPFGWIDSGSGSHAGGKQKQPEKHRTDRFTGGDSKYTVRGFFCGSSGKTSFRTSFPGPGAWKNKSYDYVGGERRADGGFDGQNTSRSVKESSGTSTQEEDSSQSTVYEKEAGGGETPYVTKETAPKIRGVLVAAQGGDDPENVRNITEAVMALFHIEAHKIKVMKMK